MPTTQLFPRDTLWGTQLHGHGVHGKPTSLTHDNLWYRAFLGNLGGHQVLNIRNARSVCSVWHYLLAS
jgi:hypothetical protein